LLEGTDENSVGGRVPKAFRSSEEKDEGKRLMVSRVAEKRRGSNDCKRSHQ
jgi:hypothetical protein